MIKDMLEFLYKKAEEGSHPEPHQVPLGGRHFDMYVKGEKTSSSMKKPMLNHSVDSLLSLMKIVDNYGNNPAVYVGKDGVDSILDDDDRLERASIDFEQSPQLIAIGRAAGGLTQAEFVRMLRTTLSGCVQHETFLSIVRQVRWELGQERTGSVKHGSDSLGNKVNRSVTANAGEMPETVRVSMPYLVKPTDAAIHLDFECAVDIDLDRQTIALLTVGDQLQVQIAIGIAKVVEQLEEGLPNATIVTGSVSSFAEFGKGMR